MKTEYDIIFKGDADLLNTQIEDALKSSLTSGNKLGAYILDTSTIDSSGEYSNNQSRRLCTCGTATGPYPVPGSPPFGWKGPENQNIHNVTSQLLLWFSQKGPLFGTSALPPFGKRSSFCRSRPPPQTKVGYGPDCLPSTNRSNVFVLINRLLWKAIALEINARWSTHVWIKVNFVASWSNVQKNNY